eukprot:1152296-Pelagomonas_calceolata.AAC.3
MRSSANARDPTANFVVGFLLNTLRAFTEAPIFIASPSGVKPAQEGFHVYEEKERREGIPLNGAPFYWDVLCILAIGEANSGVCLLVEVFDNVNGIRREAKILHEPEQFVMVCCVEGRGEIYIQCIHISVEEFRIFKGHD